MSLTNEMRKYASMLTEARVQGDPNISYQMGAKTKKAEKEGDFDSVTAKLSGIKEQVPNKLAAQSLELKTQIEELQSKRDDLHSMMGTGADLYFDATDAILTRYVETSKAIITYSRETNDEVVRQEEVDYKAVLHQIYQLVDKSLLPEIEMAIRNNTKIIEKIKKGSGTRVAVRGKDQTIESVNEDNEGESRAEGWAKNYSTRVVSKMENYDSQLSNILSQAH